MVKIFTTVNGETWNAHRTFVDNVAAKVKLTEVQRWEECDVILEFCPVSSRPGPDIDAALKDIPANKPAVLVVMHHTYDPNRSVYDSSNYVTQSDVLSVDCLFYETKGLFRCPANDEAVGKTITYIRKYSKESRPVQHLAQRECLAAPVLPEQTSSKSLREIISIISPTAARNMRAAGVSDAQIFTITLPELTELLPGMENFQKRREIMELIRQHFETSSLREKISNISQTAAENLRAAGVSDAQIFTLTLPELTELLPGMENFQKRREIMNLIRQHFETSSLREKISNISQMAAENLRGVSDAQISPLTLLKLTELLPGMENFQKRREIMDFIRQHFELQVSEVLQEHRRLLEEQERQLQAALETTRLRIDLLDKLAKWEELPGKQPREGTKSPESVASIGEPSRSSPLNQNPHAPLADRPAVLPDENSTSSSPIYNSSPPPVSSAPFQTDKKANSSSAVKVHISGDPSMGRNIFLNKLGVRITDSSLEECSVILSLCPVTTLTGREMRAALSKIPDNKDVILVVIHQTPQTFNPCRFVEIIEQKRNIVEAVHYISYQSSGLANSDINGKAISRLRLVLQRYGPIL